MLSQFFFHLLWSNHFLTTWSFLNFSHLCQSEIWCFSRIFYFQWLLWYLICYNIVFFFYIRASHNNYEIEFYICTNLLDFFLLNGFFSFELFMISLLGSLIIKVLFLYLSIFVLSGACSFKRTLKAELNALYASFSKCINFSCKTISRRSISKYL